MERFPLGLRITFSLVLIAAFVIPASSAHAVRGSVPPQAGGQTFVAPPTIDATGVTDVTDPLNRWLATDTSDGRPGAPNRIVLNGTYRVEYGLSLGSSGHDVANPLLAAYERDDVELDLTHATLLQTDSAVVSPRKRWGVPLVTVYRGDDVTVRGGNLVGSNWFGQYSRPREAWHGVDVDGATDLHLDDLRIAGVWGDFVYVNHAGRTPSRQVALDGGRYQRNGRQGVTINSADGLEISGVEFRDVQRMLFDHEPGRNGALANVDIHDCTGASGNLGYLSVHPAPVSPLHDLTVRDNRLDHGHFRVDVDASGVQREHFAFTNNTSDAGGPYDRKAPLIQVGGPGAGFDGVTIEHNRDEGSASTAAVSVSSSTGVIVAANDFRGFWDEAAT
jgi:hypothetical protein